jgi:hypothetical protein
MKLKFQTERGMHVEVTNPDEAMKKMYKDAIRDKYDNEAFEFIQECAVAARNIKPGQRIELKSRPIEVIIERDVEQQP